MFHVLKIKCYDEKQNTFLNLQIQNTFECKNFIIGRFFIDYDNKMSKKSELVQKSAICKLWTFSIYTCRISSNTIFSKCLLNITGISF